MSMVTYHDKSNGSAIPFGKHQKLWAMIWGDAVFLLFLACSADLDTLCSGSIYHHFKFDSFIFMHKISTRVVCVNGKHPISPYGHFHIRDSSLSAEKSFLLLSRFTMFSTTVMSSSCCYKPQYCPVVQLFSWLHRARPRKWIPSLQPTCLMLTI